MGRMGLINSGGASGANDFADAATIAVINKRAGGMGLISGREAFQRPVPDDADSYPGQNAFSEGPGLHPTTDSLIYP